MPDRSAARLEMQASERESAVQGLDLGVAGHPLEPVLRTAIETCNRLFMRTLKRRSQFSSLVESSADASCGITGHVRVESSQPLVVGLACDHATMNAIASAFLSMPGSARDDALAQDALGELINVLMGYVVKETLPEDARYHARPRRISRSRSQACCRAMRSRSRWCPSSVRSCWWSVAAAWDS